MRILDKEELSGTIWLVDKELKNKISISNIETLFILNKLTIRKKSAIGSYICFGGKFYIIEDIEVLSRHSFSIFFNHWYNVKVFVNSVSDVLLINKIQEVISKNDEEGRLY
ncbi:MAG: hypothetical protein N4A35_10140 [Flavobacteriales bacterium]|jgi:hypothetical protein|nr:hypothetical protein [Flavobacteriales bacterium]